MHRVMRVLVAAFAGARRLSLEGLPRSCAEGARPQSGDLQNASICAWFGQCMCRWMSVDTSWTLLNPSVARQAGARWWTASSSSARTCTCHRTRRWAMQLHTNP